MGKIQIHLDFQFQQVYIEQLSSGELNKDERRFQFLVKGNRNDSLDFLLCKMAVNYGYSLKIKRVVKTSGFMLSLCKL